MNDLPSRNDFIQAALAAIHPFGTNAPPAVERGAVTADRSVAS